MRRTILLCCITAFAVLGIATAAQAGTQSTTLGIGLSTTKARANSKLTVRYTNTTTADISNAPQQNHLVVWFPKGASVDFKDFPSCTVPASARVPASCAKARLGPGIAFNEARLDDNHNVKATLNVYNGGGKYLYLPAVVTQPADVVIYIRGTLTKVNSGPYGLRLDVPLTLPVILPDTQAPFIKNFTIGPVGAFRTVKGKQVSFITNPSTCSSAGWAFRIDSTYIDGSTSSATTSVKCKK